MKNTDSKNGQDKALKPYAVTYYYHTSATAYILASSEEEAKRIGYNYIDNDEIIENLTEDDSPDCVLDEEAIMAKKETEKTPEPQMFVVYDKGIKFLEPKNSPVIACNLADAEKVCTYLNDYFGHSRDRKGHAYNYEVIPVPDGMYVVDFVKGLLDWAFEFDEWREYGEDYYHFFNPEYCDPDELDADGSIRSLNHVEG